MQEVPEPREIASASTDSAQSAPRPIEPQPQPEPVPPPAGAGPEAPQTEPPSGQTEPPSATIQTPSPEPQRPPAQHRHEQRNEPVEPADAPRPTVAAQQSFRTSHRRVVALVETHASDGALEEEVDRFLDYRFIAEQSLGGSARFETRCAPRCADFEALLTKLIRRNYLTRVRQSERGSVSYTGEEYRQDGTVAKVDTRIAFRDKTGIDRSMDVDYVMHRRASGWKVRDIYTDGVGLAKTYRHEFNAILDEGGIEKLIGRLEAKLTELEDEAASVDETHHERAPAVR